MKYFLTSCFWCEKDMSQRYDTYKRQIAKYGHNCCKICFGRESSFKSARSLVMLSDNPFKGQKHTQKTKSILSEIKKGTVAWNKGMTKENSSIIHAAAEKVSKSKIGKYVGSNNPNWKGGITPKIRPVPANFKKWMDFRFQKIKDDCFKCAKCGDQHNSNGLELHHIASRFRYQYLEFDETNCITLCRKCHKEFHKNYGRKKFTPGDTYEWLNKDRTPNNFFISC